MTFVRLFRLRETLTCILLGAWRLGVFFLGRVLGPGLGNEKIDVDTTDRYQYIAPAQRANSICTFSSTDSLLDSGKLSDLTNYRDHILLDIICTGHTLSTNSCLFGYIE
jgi:hypothetical protein